MRIFKKTELHTSKMFACINILKNQNHSKLNNASRNKDQVF